jgi:GTP-binding protein
LLSAFVLVDIRHEPQKTDLEFMEWLGENGIPFSIIFTKADKLKPKAIKNHVAAYIRELLNGVWEEAPPHFVTSSANFRGKDEVLGYIETINKEFFEEQMEL